MSAAVSQTYCFGDTDVEQRRLVAQAESFELPARWLLDQIRIQPGWRTIDIGCGPLGILHLLSERVGSNGVVVGLEREPRFAHMAQDQLPGANWVMSQCCKRMSWQVACRIAPSISRTSGWS